MINIPDYYYRISIKALVLNAEKKFLLTKESSGFWEFPGGGLDFGEDHRTCLKREIREEMGLHITHIESEPAYFYTFFSAKNKWTAHVLYVAELEDYNFTPSDECVELRFFNKEEASKEKIFPNIPLFIQMFDPNKH